MYHPFFRGKQYELITIRENARLLKDAGFVPIVEPVKESLNGLVRALAEVENISGRAILIVNPNFGDHADDATAIQELLDGPLATFKSLSAGVLLNADANVVNVRSICAKQGDRKGSTRSATPRGDPRGSSPRSRNVTPGETKFTLASWSFTAAAWAARGQARRCVHPDRSCATIQVTSGSRCCPTLAP